MLKRILILAACFMLCSLPVQAEEAVIDLIDQAVYRIVLRTGEGDVPLGSGVLFIEPDILLTAEACCAEGEMVAIGRDGEHPVLAWEAAGRAGAALIQLAEDSAAQPLFLSSYDANALTCLFGVNSQGNVVIAPMYHLRQDVYCGQSALAISSGEGLLPGAVLADEKGQVVSLVVAQQAEGAGVYTGLDPDSLYAAIVNDDEGETFLPLTIAWEEGMLTVAWEGEARTDGLYLITISGEPNSYYTSFEADHTLRSLQLAVPPGENYYLQAQWVPEGGQAASPVWSAMTFFAVPEGEYTARSFRQSCYLAVLPAGKKAAGILPEADFVSADALADSKLDHYLQIICHYEADTEAQSPMTVTLTAPDEQFYYEEMSFIFSPEYALEDAFTVPVDELLDTCVRFSGGTLLPGDYTLSYSIAGLRAGTYAFTVQPAGDPAPDDGAAEETGAILRGITAEYRDGLFTLDWSAAQVPQDAKVTAYLLLDGNQYYTYYGMNDGETAVDFPAVPGVAGMVWAAWSMEGTGQPVFPQYQEEFVTLIPPEGTPYTLNGFTHLRGGLTLTDRADPESTAAFLPETALTREALLDDGLRLVFQTEDTYQVAEESAGHPLVFALFTPEGWIFTEQGAYTFTPDVAASDLWLRDLSSIVQSYVSFAGEDAWPAGEYTFGYYIDGQTAAEYTFTLE